MAFRSGIPRAMPEVEQRYSGLIRTIVNAHNIQLADATRAERWVRAKRRSSNAGELELFGGSDKRP